ncbi:MAG: hypothetical protein E6J73_13960 [Deltaproteobacteria bacterium]|nr:MAG: hypothetical protein E6J73_13960 [Deltaproteobacteria bacterium]
MKKLWMPVVILFVTITGVRVATAQNPSDRAVVRLDPALDALVSPDAKLEVVKGGFGFTEGQRDLQVDAGWQAVRVSRP